MLREHAHENAYKGQSPDVGLLTLVVEMSLARFMRPWKKLRLISIHRRTGNAEKRLLLFYATARAGGDQKK